MKSFKQHLDDPIEEGLLYSVNPKLANWIDRKIHKKTYKTLILLCIKKPRPTLPICQTRHENYLVGNVFNLAVPSHLNFI